MRAEVNVFTHWLSSEIKKVKKTPKHPSSFYPLETGAQPLMPVVPVFLFFKFWSYNILRQQRHQSFHRPGQAENVAVNPFYNLKTPSPAKPLLRVCPCYSALYLAATEKVTGNVSLFTVQWGVIHSPGISRATADIKVVKSLPPLFLTWICVTVLFGSPCELQVSFFFLPSLPPPPPHTLFQRSERTQGYMSHFLLELPFSFLMQPFSLVGSRLVHFCSKIL